VVRVARDEILDRVNERVNRVLTVAELCLSKEQYPLFRKIVLDEFGRSGLGRDLEALGQKERQGQDG
jgi:hypothetical protein